ncbi:hypothetical protein HMPREF0294_1990 [Corynebacterium glucuronolyticum ATCC 51867]|nr:hypothetical protein HMPREF0294_1990 [Corynebacterium glucuronolyticum ATCC 51867]
MASIPSSVDVSVSAASVMPEIGMMRRRRSRRGLQAKRTVAEEIVAGSTSGTTTEVTTEVADATAGEAEVEMTVRVAVTTGDAASGMIGEAAAGHVARTHHSRYPTLTPHA